MAAMVWLVGAGLMGVEYIKVLQKMGVPFCVIGRGEISAKKCEEKTGAKVIAGGLHRFLDSNPEKCKMAIVCVPVEELKDATAQLLNYGIDSILLEKPGAVDSRELKILCDKARQNNAKVFIAYNRRFYTSVITARKMIENDGGVTSFLFEFTEWSHEIENLKKHETVKQNWFLANSSHVVDLAFYLTGKPKVMECFTSGSLSWHSRSSVFTGAGYVESGIPFSYHANWAAPGRWGVEMLTKRHRYILRPMEQLQLQKIGSVSIETVELDCSIDVEFKPGLYRQVETFLEGKSNDLCTLEEQRKMMDYYCRMANY